jgi:23S rRNA (cytidine1920-2'-O)/16S rRNA (cytidine1409-2'-O)-methyltransferase
MPPTTTSSSTSSVTPPTCQFALAWAAMKKRVDVLLVERGLAESRSKAQALVLAGLVEGHEKPGMQIDEDTELVVGALPRFVSRGGEKLAHALDALGVDPAGKDCLDIGASTGGFTDCLLQRGARRVVAVDVGYGQLHPRLRADSRVHVLERVNVRALTTVPYPPQIVTCDVSFISVGIALPPALALASAGWEALVLVKPQFEAGRADAPKGVVRDPEVHRRVLAGVCDAAGRWGARVGGVVDSGLPGPKGNREFVLHLIESDEPTGSRELERSIDDAVA